MFSASVVAQPVKKNAQASRPTAITNLTERKDFTAAALWMG